MALFSDQNPRFITTIDGAWLVAIRSANEGRLITKTFRRQTPESLQKAIKWRDRAYWRLFGKPVPNRVFHSAQKDTATGFPGVRFQLRKLKNRKGKPYTIPVIIAEVFTIPGEDYVRPKGSKSRSFSLNIYDWDEAIALGVAWRSEMIEKLEQ
jgi:hypothetical protein